MLLKYRFWLHQRTFLGPWFTCQVLKNQPYRYVCLYLDISETVNYSSITCMKLGSYREAKVKEPNDLKNLVSKTEGKSHFVAGSRLVPFSRALLIKLFQFMYLRKVQYMVSERI